MHVERRLMKISNEFIILRIHDSFQYDILELIGGNQLNGYW